MSEDSNASVMLTRPDLDPVAAQFQQRVWKADTPPGEEDVIRLRDGHVLRWMPETPETLRGMLVEGFADFADAADAAIIEPDRRLFRVPTMFAEVATPRGARTWNLERIGIRGGKHPTGKGAVVAVLDSGLDFKHPDFPQVEGIFPIIDRNAFDEVGHGTHCAGIIAGPKQPRHEGCPRYGIAPDAALLVVNVYDGNGVETTDWNLLRGIVTAANAGAHIISISVGRVPTDECPRFSRLFELVARILRDVYGTIIVAAAGNESDRLEPYLGPIVHPADCPSIIAVAAVNQQLEPSRTSSAGICEQRMPTLAAPGVEIFSAFLTRAAGPDGPYHTLNGTSAAAPHVAGVAALWVEQGYRGKALCDQLIATVQKLPGQPRDVGAGLVQAP